MFRACVSTAKKGRGRKCAGLRGVIDVRGESRETGLGCSRQSHLYPQGCRTTMYLMTALPLGRWDVSWFSPKFPVINERRVSVSVGTLAYFYHAGEARVLWCCWSSPLLG